MSDSVAIKTTAMTENDRQFHLIRCPRKISLRRHLSQELNDNERTGQERILRVRSGGRMLQIQERANKSLGAETSSASLKIEG